MYNIGKKKRLRKKMDKNNNRENKKIKEMLRREQREKKFDNRWGFKDGRPTKFAICSYKVLMVLFYTLILASVYGVVVALIYKQVENDVLYYLLNAISPVLYIFAVMWMNKKLKSKENLNLSSIKWRDVLFFSFTLIAYMALIFFIYINIEEIKILYIENIKDILSNKFFYISIISDLSIAIAFTVLYRLYIFRNIRNLYGFKRAMIATALIGSVFSMFDLEAIKQVFPILNTFLIMAIFILIYEISQSSALSVLLNFIFEFLKNNFFGFSHADSKLNSSILNLTKDGKNLLNLQYSLEGLWITSIVLSVFALHLYLMYKKKKQGE